jgi:hypothetical protein
MPFIELKPIKTFIRVHEKTITISSSFLHFFKKNNELQKVKIFLDEENHLVGFQPSNEGYKLSIKGGGYSITCAFLTKKLPKKDYLPTWNTEHKMLVFSY